MERWTVLVLCSAFLLFALIKHAYAASGSFVDQFLGNPLLVLVVIVIIDAIAFVYRKIRK
jgi:hypothetical protein